MSVVLITGTSTGIGLATALHVARLGWDVHAGLRNPAAATELAQAIETEQLPIRPVVIDVDDDASVTRGVGEVLERAGRIDALVNNAGIGGGGPIEDVPVDWVLPGGDDGGAPAPLAGGGGREAPGRRSPAAQQAVGLRAEAAVTRLS